MKDELKEIRALRAKVELIQDVIDSGPGKDADRIEVFGPLFTELATKLDDLLIERHKRLGVQQ